MDQKTYTSAFKTQIQLKLCYDAQNHNKVFQEKEKDPACMFLPRIQEGVCEPCLLWFTFYRNKHIVLLFHGIQEGFDVSTRAFQPFESWKGHQTTRIESLFFDFSLTQGNGTLLQGCLVHAHNFFAVENVLLYEGNQTGPRAFVDLCCTLFPRKIAVRRNYEKNNILHVGLPYIMGAKERVDINLPSLPYEYEEWVQGRRVEEGQMDALASAPGFAMPRSVRLPLRNSVPMRNSIQTQNLEPTKPTPKPVQVQAQTYTKTFMVKPDIQNDIYHLYTHDAQKKYIGVALIPDYKTSVFMNRHFRNIKENANLDALEESDDEEEFENCQEDKYVFLDKALLMKCSFHSKFKKYVPIELASAAH